MPDGLALPLLPDVVRRPSREAAPIDPRLRWRIGAGIVVGHLVLLLLVDASLRPRFAVPQRVDAGVQIRWIDITLPALPAPAPDAAAVVPDATPPPDAATIGPADAASAPAVSRAAETLAAEVDDGVDTARLFDPDGQLRLSAAVVDAAAQGPAPGFAPPAREGLAPIRSPIPYRKTRFDDDWVPDGETLGDELMRKVTLEKEIKTPWGTRWRCAIVLVFAACGDVPPPAMKNPPKMPWETYVEEDEPPALLDF